MTVPKIRSIMQPTGFEALQGIPYPPRTMERGAVIKQAQQDRARWEELESLELVDAMRVLGNLERGRVAAHLRRAIAARLYADALTSLVVSTPGFRTEKEVVEARDGIPCPPRNTRAPWPLESDEARCLIDARLFQFEALLGTPDVTYSARQQSFAPGDAENDELIAGLMGVSAEFLRGGGNRALAEAHREAMRDEWGRKIGRRTECNFHRYTTEDRKAFVCVECGHGTDDMPREFDEKTPPFLQGERACVRKFFAHAGKIVTIHSYVPSLDKQGFLYRVFLDGGDPSVEMAFVDSWMLQRVVRAHGIDYAYETKLSHAIPVNALARVGDVVKNVGLPPSQDAAMIGTPGSPAGPFVGTAFIGMTSGGVTVKV